MALNKSDLITLAKTVANADPSSKVAYSFGEDKFSYSDLNETLSLLSSIGYTLSEDQDFDKVIIKSIKNKNYNIEKIEEELLYKYDIDWTSRR